MKRNSEKYILSQTIEWEDLGDGVSRQVLGFDNQIMMVKVKFEKGAIGAAHQHFQPQTAYVAEGKFEFYIEDVKQIIEAGDGIYVEPNLVHGVTCLEAGILIDVFSPVREDFLSSTTIPK